MPTRFDAAWMVNGRRVQYSLDYLDDPLYPTNHELISDRRIEAEFKFNQIAKGLGNPESIPLSLPRGCIDARLYTIES